MDYANGRRTDIDVVILNLNEINVVKDSLRRIAIEGHGIIVVDNGSDDESKEILRGMKDITLVDLPENTGPSKGRNAGLEKTTAPYVLLLDGDILYIPGSAYLLQRRLENLPDAGCVGIHNPNKWDGTQIREEAHTYFPSLDYEKVFKDFDMAWTQYGVFRGDLLRECGFYEEGIFGEPGIGYEDDWLWHDMKKRGYASYYVPDVLYYHEKHGGARFLKAKGIPVRSDERYEIFKEHWKSPAWNEKPLHSDYLSDQSNA